LGEKSSSVLIKYAEKIETIVLIVISFSIYFIFNTSVAAVIKKDVPDLFTVRAGVYFDGEILTVQKSLIAKAAVSIKAATYTYSAGVLSELLEKRKDEGLNVKIVAGNNKDNSMPGFDFSIFKTKYGIYHPKFMVIDSKDVLISSSNFSSDNRSSNSAVLFKDVPQAAEILENEIDNISSGVIEKRCSKGCETEIGTIFFNPGKGCMAIKGELLKSESSIKAAVYTVTTKNPVITGLKNRIKNGIDVDMIFDDWKGDDRTIVNKRAFQYLSSIGADVKYDEDPAIDKALFHHKFAVIDHSTTVFGSMNWTSSGCYRNRELIVISKDQKIAKEFESFFDRYKKF
jgi:phosphatidylserine/phosphatidylglycerophosphate/cardiolipin synthase-like enzyme